VIYTEIHFGVGIKRFFAVAPLRHTFLTQNSDCYSTKIVESILSCCSALNIDPFSISMLLVDHIGIATHDAMILEKLLKKLAQYSSVVPQEVAQQGVRVRFYGKDTRIEVLESIYETSALARFLAKRGDGLHHIAFRVNDIQCQFERMVKEGLQPLTDTPVSGSEGKRIFFLHPRDTCGVLVEFCQPTNQYTVLFQHCDELEKEMVSSGYCIASESALEHVVSSKGVPNNSRSIVIHNASSKLLSQKIKPPSMPVLISEVSSQSRSAHALQSLWTTAQVVVLPEGTQQKCLPAVLLDFWESVEHG